MPRWLLLGLLTLAVVMALLRLFDVRRAEAPEDCLAAERAFTEEDYNRAIDHYLLCLESEELPEQFVAHVFYSLGNAYAAKGNHYQAIKDYSEAIALDPRHAWAHNNRCWSYGLLRRPEEALADCDEALRLLPDQPEILDSRALAYWLLDEKVKARDDLERARRINPAVPTWEERFREFEAMF